MCPIALSEAPAQRLEGLALIAGEVGLKDEAVPLWSSSWRKGCKASAGVGRVRGSSSRRAAVSTRAASRSGREGRVETKEVRGERRGDLHFEDQLAQLVRGAEGDREPFVLPPRRRGPSDRDETPPLLSRRVGEEALEEGENGQCRTLGGEFHLLTSLLHRLGELEGHCGSLVLVEVEGSAAQLLEVVAEEERGDETELAERDVVAADLGGDLEDALHPQLRRLPGENAGRIIDDDRIAAGVGVSAARVVLEERPRVGSVPARRGDDDEGLLEGQSGNALRLGRVADDDPTSERRGEGGGRVGEGPGRCRQRDRTPAGRCTPRRSSRPRRRGR